jgi:hypothetical protein
MKYLKKLFNEKEKSIEDWCALFLTNYEINDDNTIDTNGGVYLKDMNLDKIPFKFGIVKGRFNCGNNKLTSLKNAPKKVGYEFYCSNNKLTSLKYSPVDVGSDFECFDNELITLEGSPTKIKGSFYCFRNKLTSLIGGPKEADTYFCSRNKLISLEGAPIKVGFHFMCSDNPIYEVYKIFILDDNGRYNTSIDYERYKASLDYNYWRDGKINKRRFEMACEDIGIVAPDSIPGYEYI